MSYKKYNGIEYKKDGIDYSEQMGIAEGQGDFDLAAQYERQHNAKVLGEGLDYELSYKYTKPEDYGFIPDSKKCSSAVPSTTSRSDAMNLLLSDLQKPSSFTYNPQSDPLYKNYKEQAERSAKNVSEDVMAQAAAMTGGMPSSYAVSAASQAASRQMQQADNMIPELYRLALDKYNAERSDKYKQLGVLMDLDNTEYNRGVYADKVAYSRGRDALDDERYDEETAYNRGIYADETAYNRGIYADETEYNRGVYADETEYNRGVYADEVERQRNLEDMDIERTKGLDAAESKQTALNNVIALLGAGIPVTKEQLEAAGLGHLTPESAREYITANAAAQQKVQNSGGVAPKEKELKSVTPSMYTSLEKVLTDEEKGGVAAFERELSKYNWDEYDKQGIIDYFGANYSDIPGIDKVLAKYGGKIVTDTAGEDSILRAGWNAVASAQGKAGETAQYGNSVSSSGKYVVDGVGEYTESELIDMYLNDEVDVILDSNGKKKFVAI